MNRPTVWQRCNNARCPECRKRFGKVRRSPLQDATSAFDGFRIRRVNNLMNAQDWQALALGTFGLVCLIIFLI